MLTLTPVVMQIRDGAEHEKYGDPFTVSGILTIYEDEAFVTGLVGSGFTKESFRTFYSFLRDSGVKIVRWKRRKGDMEYEKIKYI